MGPKHNYVLFKNILFGAFITSWCRGQSVEEHLLFVKSMIQSYINLKSGVIMLVDIEKLFDAAILRTVKLT